MHHGALSSVRVVDLGSGVAPSVAAMIFGDFGADVVKVEPAGGDPLRPDPGFAVWNRNKRGVVVDWSTADGHGELVRLLTLADVCIHGGGDATAERDACVAEAVLANPRLVVLSLPPSSPSTPWLGDGESNGLLSAVTGHALRQSSYDDVPVDPVYPHIAYLQGIWGATCSVAALVERDRSGHGQVVTVDGLQASLIAGSVTSVLDPAELDRPVVPAGPGGPSPCYTRYQCADGEWIFLGALSEKFQRHALEALDLKAMLDDDRLDGQLDRMLTPDNRVWVRAMMADRFLTRTRDEWMAVLDGVDCPSGPLLHRETWLDHPQLQAIDMRVQVEDPERGTVTMPGVALGLSATPGTVRRPAPRLGETSPDALDWAPRADPPRGTGSPAGADPEPGRGPLAGVRILNLGTVLAGPYAGSLLCELGADVIKVEPLGGDSHRLRGFAFNRGMRSVAIDLRSEAGRAAFDELVRSADVVLDNFRPGVLARLGIEYPALAAVNPKIVAISLTGFGNRGPLSAMPGFDPILQAMSGMMYAQGGDDEPVFLTVAVNDVAGACLCALAACLTVFHCGRTGEGQAVDASLAAFSAFMQSGELVRFAGRRPADTGGRDHPGPGPLDRYYRCRDGWVRLQATPSQLATLADAGWLPPSTDSPRPDGDTERSFTDAFRARAAAEAVAALAGIGVAAAVAIRPVDLLRNPGVQASETFHEYPLSGGQTCFAPGRTAHFSRTQQRGVLVAPGLGEHSREVLAESGLDATAICRLLDDHAIAEGGPIELRAFEAYR